MSAQFGQWNFDGARVAEGHLEAVNETLARWGPDNGAVHREGGLGLVFRSFVTIEEQISVQRPLTTESGCILMWDGRLDNRDELASELGENLRAASSDLILVAKAHEQWGCACFARLVGDWAISIWNPRDQSLTLARDFAGARTLFYSLDGTALRWCTVLKPLIDSLSISPTLSEEYIAGWLGLFPGAHLSPYEEIHSVPPSSAVTVKNGAVRIRQYWTFDPGKKINYRTDEEYEEHFRQLFAQSVARRLRSKYPVLSELSGGMDSSSIVCVADELLVKGLAATPRLDTLSYFDDSEPNWNERQYFEIVEKRRGRSGCHVDLSQEPESFFQSESDEPAATPATRKRPQAARAYSSVAGHRVLLSGLGGDEVLGGVPTATPELADCLAAGRFFTLATRLWAWALAQRRPYLDLLTETTRQFLPIWLSNVTREVPPAAWLRGRFLNRNLRALQGYPQRTHVFGPRPSFQENLSTLALLQRQITCLAVPTSPLMDRRFPFLDRDLLEFVYAIPRTQIVRTGQRRSLMRRALRASIPAEILWRKRKAYVTRGPIRMMQSDPEVIFSLTRGMISAKLDIVAPEILGEELAKASSGQEVHWVQILRTLALEHWLRTCHPHRTLGLSQESRQILGPTLAPQRTDSAALTKSAS